MALHAVLDVTLAVPDPQGLIDFWVRRGLVHDGRGSLGTPERPVQLRVEEGAFRRLTDWHLGAESPADLDAIAARLADLGLAANRSDGRLVCTDPIQGHTVTIDVTDPPPAATVGLRPSNGPGRLERRGRRADAVEAERPRAPRRVGHVVFGTPDVAASSAFYVGALGFRVSDQVMNGAAVFARCSADHHNLLLMPARTPYLNHYAIEMDDFDAIAAAGYEILSERSDASVVGIGRHLVGSNVFWYFTDPAGNTFELFADMDQIVDDAAWDAEHRRDDWDTSFAVWGPEPPKRFFVPEDLADIAAGRAAAGLDPSA